MVVDRVVVRALVVAGARVVTRAVAVARVRGPVEKMCFFLNGPNSTSECFNLLY